MDHSIRIAIPLFALAVGLASAAAVAGDNPQAGSSAAAPRSSDVVPAGTEIPSEPGALLSLVLDLDRRMFAAYDAHDVDALMSFFATDLEFYHDTGGLLAHGQVRDGFRGVFAANPDIRRELVPDSTRVFPVKGYGAIQTGRHRFCHTEGGKPDCGTFEFVQVWRLRDGKWQVARELSYGH